MSEGSPEQRLGGVESDAVQQMQAQRDAYALQNSPGARVQTFNVWSLLGFKAADPHDIDRHWAKRILEKQAGEIENRLDQILLNSVQATIDLTERPEAIAQSKSLRPVRILKTEGQGSEVLEANRPMVEVFDRRAVEGRLLILGTPGAGKTTELLGLAKALVDRALENLAHPEGGISSLRIPIIFELSVWRNDGQSIKDWLIEQLCENFGGGKRKRQVYRLWLEREILLPLMDGLDELGLVRQKKCMQKLNEFAQNYSPLVICCRSKEYKQSGLKLSNLLGAVELQPLSNRQISEYLHQVQKDSLWMQIQSEPEMRQ